MRRTAPMLAGITLLVGCGEPIAMRTTADTRPGAAASQAPGGGEDDFAALRRVTAPFREFENAVNAGWSAQITPCMTDPEAGGMGVHYGNTALIDGSVRVDEPELLLYEPGRNGRRRLVAVEYIVPLSAWTSPQPPRLYGRDFKVNAAFQIWALHVWLWKHNPSGLFADWNPQVGCEHATAVSTMTHR